MSKKLGITLAPLLIVAAFVMPAAAQAVTPHFFINGVKAEQGVKIPFISWGKLSLTSSAPGSTPAECENISGGFVENPVGGGPGKAETNGWAPYNCINSGCSAIPGGKLGILFENANGPGLATRLEWPAELTNTVAKTIRLKSTNVRVFTRCQFVHLAPADSAGPEGTTQRTYTEIEAGGSTCETAGTGTAGVSEAKIQNGVNAEAPSKLVFDAGAGTLNCGESRGITGGSEKVMGYAESETITAKEA